MELQWPLIFFTTFSAWACGVFACQGVLALADAKHEKAACSKKTQSVLTVISVVLLAIGGIAVFFHLEHWERIFNGFGHITSGITQELIAIVVFVVVALVYFIVLRKTGEEQVLPKWLAVLAILISVVLACVCAHSYMMAARPVWNTWLEVLSIVGAACLLGPVTCAIVMACRGEEMQVCGLPCIVGSVLGVLCTAAYALFIQMSSSSFTSVGNYFDPNHPTSAMIDVSSIALSQAPFLWIGAVLVGAIVPLVCVCIAKRKGNASAWKVLGCIALAAAFVGALCLRVAFYNMGLSVFMFY